MRTASCAYAAVGVGEGTKSASKRWFVLAWIAIVVEYRARPQQRYWTACGGSQTTCR
jgi:hypothetical protein